MARIAGFLVGSAAAVALMLLVIGLPELGAPEPPPAEPAASSLPEPPPALAPAPEPAPKSVPESTAAAPPESSPIAPGEPAPTPAPARWHAFWSPFGSRIAADGFVRRLESITGFDYRVVKVENGIYEVAFAYSDDQERDAKLATIAAAAGLELPDS